MTYEAHLSRLQAIVAGLDREGVPLDDAMKLFEEGIEILRMASDELTAAEGKVRLLIENAQGVLATRDIDA